MKRICFIFLLFFSEFLYGQNLYDTTHTKIFADYLYNTRQYKFAAQEYSTLADSISTNNLYYALKSIECYSIVYDYNNALSVFDKSVLPAIDTNYNLFFDYVKLLIRNNNYQKAYQYCDSVHSPFLIKSYNIKYLLSIINDCNYALDYQLLLPEVKTMSQSVVKQKKMFTAVALSSVMPGLGRIYCGYVSEGIIALLRSCFDYMHIAYGFKKYGFSDPYPLFFATISACFYIGNIFGTIKSVKKYNSTQIKLRDEKILDFMYNNLF